MPQVLIPIAISIAISAVLKVGVMLLTAKTKKPQTPELGQRTITQTFRQPIGYWRRIYGEARVGGHPVYQGSPVSVGNFQQVTVFACHEVTEIRTVFIGERAVYDTDLDADGYATGSRWTKTWQTGSAGYLAIWKKLGAAGQTAFDSLIARSNGEWTADHKLTGHAAVHTEFSWEENIYAGGLPNVSAVIRGDKVYDTRDATTKWTPNAALVIRDFFLTAKTELGLDADTDEISDAEWSSAANVCDEIVATPTTGDAAVMHTVVAFDPSAGTVELDGDVLKLQWGDRFEFATDGALPTGLSAATAYYAIPVRDRKTESEAGRRVAIRVASSLANAYAATAASFSGTGSGTATITKTGEPRWTINGSFTSDQNPRNVLEEMLASCGMRVPYSNGQFRPMGLAWEAPTLSLDESDLRGPLKVSTKRPQRDRFNALKGTYVNPANDWQPSDYPALAPAAYEAADGERIFNDFDQPYTSRSGQAQRAAKLELARNRFERVVGVPALLTAYDCKAGDAIGLSNDRWEWSDKSFEVIERRPVIEDGDEDEGPYLGIDLVGNETSEDIYDWASTEEQADPPVYVPTLPDWKTVAAPGAPEVAESLYEGRDGSDVKAQVTLTWIASTSGLVNRYEIEYKLTSDTYWLAGPSVPVDGTGETQLSATFGDFLPGQYDFRVRARTSVGALSDWAPTPNKTIFGLSADPVAITGLGLQKLGGQALLKWDLHADADVRRGGWIEFRHNPITSGASAADSTSIGDRVAGRDTTAALPLKSGTYFARAIDKLGNRGPWAPVSTDGATVIAYSTTASIQEDSTFPGTHSSTFLAGSGIALLGASLIDSWASVDAVLNWDSEGGISTSGVYTFSAGIDLGSVATKRLRGHIAATIYNPLDTIDARTANMDTWESFDGTPALSAGRGDAWIEYRQTQDDPAGTPTWTEWQRLDVTEVTARAFQFRCQLRSYDPAWNILVTQLRAYAEAGTA